MDEQPNLREFLNEVSSFSEEDATPGSGRTAAAQARGDRQGRRDRRLGVADPHGRRRAGRASVAPRPLGRNVGPGRQPGEDGGRQCVADRQRPHPSRRRQRRAGRSRRLPRRRQQGFRRHAQQLPSRRDALSDSGRRRSSGHHRRPARRSSPPATSPTSRSAPSIRPTTSAARSTSIRCCRSISPCSARPAPANRPRSR